MDTQFDQQRLIEPAALKGLLARRGAPSWWRLAVHLAVFGVLAAIIVQAAGKPWLAQPATLALACVWCGLFAPFHECTHQSAFPGQGANRYVGLLCAIPFMMAPSVYRAFHFEHHRHTQDVARDPELGGNAELLGWPPDRTGWLRLASGYDLLRIKILFLRHFSFSPTDAWSVFGEWTSLLDERVTRAESRALLITWLVFVASALTVVPGGFYLLLAFLLSHGLMALWIACEHSGLPATGTMIERTRSVRSNRLVRFFLWNMNYHAEHHAWPGMPWHQLPQAHARIHQRLPSQSDGYVALHANVLNGRNRPGCDPA